MGGSCTKILAQETMGLYAKVLAQETMGSCTKVMDDHPLQQRPPPTPV